jgi:long-chain fatty acid transport protein
MITNRHTEWIGLLLNAALLLSLSPARGAGFSLSEQGTKSMGMAGAVTAIADRPETIFFNPAGLSALDGFQIEVGFALTRPSTRYIGQKPGTTTEVAVDTSRATLFIPNLYASYRLSKEFAVGLGIYRPYGLSQAWPTEVSLENERAPWWGRSLVKTIDLDALAIHPAVAVRLHPRFSLGAGLAIVKVALNRTRAITLSSSPADDIDEELSSGGWAGGAAAGLLVKVIPDLLHASFTFRSGIGLSLAGKAVFTRNGDPAGVPAGLRAVLKDGSIQASLSLPHVFVLGFAAFPTKALALGFSGEVTTWSDYDKLQILFTENPDQSSSSPKAWRNTVCIRLGAEYRVLPDIFVRAGFFYDQGAAPSTTVGPDFPDSDRYAFTLGGGYVFSRWIKGASIDLGYQFVSTGDISTDPVAPLPGTYSSNAHFVGLSLGWKKDF